jgi:hypothetical protein
MVSMDALAARSMPLAMRVPTWLLRELARVAGLGWPNTGVAVLLT